MRGLLRRDRLTGGALAFALLVLAGLPPGIIGLVAKVVALRPAVEEGLWPLALVAVVAVVLGIAVYLRWFALLIADPGEAVGEAGEVSGRAGEVQREVSDPASVDLARVVLVVGTVLLVLLSALPGLLLGLLS